ncbi:dihydrolipoamide acetyltransferase [soil metagenome]
MSTEFVMPKLGLTMEEGTIIEWLVPDGAEVHDGTPVLVIETDKVETEVSVPGSGRLHQLAAAGATAKCGEAVGVLLGDSEEVPAPAVAADTPAPEVAQSATTSAETTRPASPATDTADTTGATRDADGRILASPNARRVAAAADRSLASIRGTGPGGRIVSEDVEEALAAGPEPTTTSTPATATPGTAPTAHSGIRLPATAAARQLADLLGVDLTHVGVDPVDGRVTREAVARHVRDLLAQLAGASSTATTDAADVATPPALAPAQQPPSRVIPMRGVRGTIAKRMHASLREMAQLTLFMDADLDAVVADRSARAGTGSAPGYTDYVIAAAARALRDHPVANSQVTDEGIAVLPDIHVGMAVAIDDGLVVPIVRHADRLGLEQLSDETTRLAGAARSKSLTLDDIEGGTFSVSALGMMGVDGFTPVINPPNAAILGVGRLRDDLVLVDGNVATVKRVTLSLTWDHRVLDGAPAAEFCRSIVQYLADPAALGNADHS